MSERESSSLRRAALDMLARREYSAAEIRAKLSKRGGDSMLIDAVLQELNSEGLQSDERFVEAFAHMHRKRGHGPLRILRELDLRGVERELAETLIEPRDEAWSELARQWRQHRFGFESPATPAQRQRQARHLQQRGFSGEQVRYALRDSVSDS